MGEESHRGAWRSAPALIAAALVLAKAPMLADPYYWDEVGCYAWQAQVMGQLGTRWDAYHGLPFVRPPGVMAPAAALLRLGATPFGLHLFMCAFGALGVLGAARICRALGGGDRAAALAAALCAATPLYFAQTGLLQLDLAAAALSAWALGMLLSGRTGAFALLGSAAVLTKESSYFLCLPAALYLARRAAGSWRRVLAPRPLLAALPALVPGVVLALWLLWHRRLVGVFIYSDHADALFSPDRIAAALLHTFIEGGRWLLVLLACLLLRPGWRRPEVLVCAIAVLAVPACFAGLPPRYVLPSLPPLAALAALGLWRLPAPRRLGASALSLAALASGWQGDSWHTNSGDHLEANLAYRALLATQREAVAAILAERPRAVVAAFPISSALTMPAGVGWAPAPLPADPGATADLAELCRRDLLVEAQGDSVAVARARLEAAGALTLLRAIAPQSDVGSRALTPPWARVDQHIRIYRIRCAHR